MTPPTRPGLAETGGLGGSYPPSRSQLCPPPAASLSPSPLHRLLWPGPSCGGLVAAPTSTGCTPLLALRGPQSTGLFIQLCESRPLRRPGLLSLELQRSALSPPLGGDLLKAALPCGKLTWTSHKPAPPPRATALQAARPPGGGTLSEYASPLPPAVPASRRGPRAEEAESTLCLGHLGSM